MDEAVAPKIGLALSGGGSRAIAFHLGCLRALSRLGLLDRVAILSTVSGGSVIGAYFHVHFHGEGGDFASFKAKIRDLLRQGLAAPMCRKLFTATGIKVVAAFIAVGLGALAVTLIKVLIKVVRLITLANSTNGATIELIFQSRSVARAREGTQCPCCGICRSLIIDRLPRRAPPPPPRPGEADIIGIVIVPDRPSSIVAPNQNCKKENRRRRQVGRPRAAAPPSRLQQIA